MISSDKNHSIKTDNVQAGKASDVHPDISSLGLLLSSHENSFSHHASNNNSDALMLHVAECLPCQKRLTVLSSLNQLHHTLDNTIVSEGQQMLIVDYVNRGFSISRKKLLRQKIQDEPSSLKAMLHYASHSEAMRMSLKENASAQESSKVDDSKRDKLQTKFNILSIISRLFMTFKMPFKWSFSFNFSTIYAVFISFLFVSLLFILLSEKTNPVAVDGGEVSTKQGSDNEVKLEFISSGLNNSSFIYALERGSDAAIKKDQRQDKQWQKTKIQNLGKVEISLNEKSALHIAWPVSKEANRYTLNFYASSNQTEPPELRVSTTGSFVELDVNNFEPEKNYRWVFTYQTQNKKTLDKKEFRATGEFVLKPFTIVSPH